ncbi:ABC transporter permease subunit [Thermoanaerobacterium thermosaccharolyticum]|uniref:ABC transporter permease subunit n=1 Tax=Thermoanaerobacterium thermosaccharolyticum TaxID=1517 RepID=UPI0004B8005E
MKIMNLAIFTIHEYFRATGFYVELLVVGTFLYFGYGNTFYNKTMPVDEAYFIMGLISCILAIVTTYRITNRERNRRIHIIMTKALSRFDYITGKAIAAFVIDFVLLMIVFVITYFYTRVSKEYSFSMAIITMIPILLIYFQVEAIILFLSPININKSAFMIGFIPIILGFYQPYGILKYILPPIQQLIKISYSGFIKSSDYGIFALSLLYIIIFFYLSCTVFKNREIDYDLS